jgi:alpha-L-rhamnosidase
MKRLLLVVIPACTMFGAASVRPQQLRCEYRVNPQGIDATEPRLSWVLTPVNPKARGLRQSAYRVLWDGGKADSADTVHIAHRG